MASAGSTRYDEDLYIQVFKARMLKLGWTHMDNIYEFEAYRLSHRNEKLLVVSAPVPPAAPHITLVDCSESEDVNSVSSKFTVNGLFAKTSSLGVEFPAQYHINDESWFEQYALLGQIHNESLAAAHVSYANAEQRLVEALRDHPLKFSDGRTSEEVANTSFAFANK